MRSEQEMYELIVNTAREDRRIRAVFMNGSRTNPNARKDIFQDYDVVYVVEETKPFIEDKTWIDRFGERLYMECPDALDKMRGKKTDFSRSYGWLIQFADGNRLDLHIERKEAVSIANERMRKVLLDKDGLLGCIPESTDEDYWVVKPDQGNFTADCTDFWWCLNNVAKGLWRREVPYVQDMLVHIRYHLREMLSYKIGYENNYQCSIGKSGKYMYRYLPEETWQQFLSTYADGQVEHIWEAVFLMCSLFEKTAKEVAEYEHFLYNGEETTACIGYLKHVRELPEDADIIY